MLCLASTAIPLLLLLPVFGGEAWWIRAFLVAMSVAGVIVLFETATAYLRLDADELLCRSGFVTKRIPKNDIQGVTWEGDVLSIRRGDGTWLKLPFLGRNTQGLANSVRAWLKQKSSKAN